MHKIHMGNRREVCVSLIPAGILNFLFFFPKSCIHVLVSCLVLKSKSLSLNALVTQGIPILLSPGVGQKKKQKTGGGNPLRWAPHMLYAT